MEGIVHYGGGGEDAVVGTAGCYGHLLMTLWTRKQRQDRKWDLAANLKAHLEGPRDHFLQLRPSSQRLYDFLNSVT